MQASLHHQGTIRHRPGPRMENGSHLPAPEISEAVPTAPKYMLRMRTGRISADYYPAPAPLGALKPLRSSIPQREERSLLYRIEAVLSRFTESTTTAPI